jgi:hypothetical protein
MPGWWVVGANVQTGPEHMPLDTSTVNGEGTIIYLYLGSLAGNEARDWHSMNCCCILDVAQSSHAVLHRRKACHRSHATESHMVEVKPC